MDGQGRIEDDDFEKSQTRARSNDDGRISRRGRRYARTRSRNRDSTHHVGRVDGLLQLLDGEGHEGLRATLGALRREEEGGGAREGEGVSERCQEDRSDDDAREECRVASGTTTRPRARPREDATESDAANDRARDASESRREPRTALGTPKRDVRSRARARTAPPSAPPAAAVWPAVKPPCPANWDALPS